MQKIRRSLLIIALVVFLMSCSLTNSLLEESGLSSDSGQAVNSPKRKAFDGELIIVDQWYSLSEGERIPYGLLLENTSSTLTISKFSLLGTINDSSGNPLPIMNLNGGTTNSMDIEVMIYPRSRQIICLSYEAPKDSKVSQVLFNIGPEIEAVDLGLQNPVMAEAAAFTEETDYLNSIGSLTGKLSNQSDQVVVFPTLDGAGYDASGKLIGCASSGMKAYNFIQPGDTLPIKIPLSGAARPASVELFPSYRSGTVQKYSGPEPIQVSEVKFTQINTYVVPSFTVKNTADGTVIDYLKNYIVYGPNDELLFVDSFRSQDFPPGQTFGPNMGMEWQVRSGKTVSRVEVQMHTMDVRQGSKIVPEAISFGPGTYDAGAYTFTATAKNAAPSPLSIAFGISCFDSSGQLLGIGSGSGELAANAEMEVTGTITNTGQADGPNCGQAERIEFSTISIYENLNE